MATQNNRIVRLGENRHPVDELADVREQMRGLKEREQELRETILGGGCTKVGARFSASVTRTKVQRLDSEAVRREFGLAVLRPFLRDSETVIVKLKER
jgi:hypothetical protein